MTADARVRVLAWPAYANTDNPYHQLLHDAVVDEGVSVEEYTPSRLRGGEWDVLHVHWPEFLVGRRGSAEAAVSVAAFFIFVALARRRGRRVVWTIHNLRPHDRRPLARLVYRAMARSVDGVISLSSSGLEAARAKYPPLRDRPAIVVPHGHFRGAYADVTRGAARKELQVRDGDHVLLFFGAVRRYKRIDSLLRAFAATAGDATLRLVIAGRPNDGELADELRTAAEPDARVSLHLNFVPDDDVAMFVRAADVVVLPYDGGVLNSSVALLGLSFDCTVLAPDVVALRELADVVGGGWLQFFDGTIEADDLQRAVAIGAARRGETCDLTMLEWSSLAERTAAFYRSLSPRRVAVQVDLSVPGSAQAPAS